MPRVVVTYERVSSAKQDITRQAAQREMAKKEHPGLEMIVIQDDGVSAFSVPLLGRPGGKKLCDLIDTGTVEAVYSDAQDRLSRGIPTEWLVFAALCHENKTRIILDGREVQDDDSGVILGVINALRARGESKDKSHRVKSGKERKFQETKLHNCPFAPAGYRKVYDDQGIYVSLEVIPEDAKIIREVFHRRASRESLVSLGAFLREVGLKTGRGESRWLSAVLTTLIRNRVYVGEARSGELVAKNAHPAIITESEWARAQNVRPSFGRDRHGKGESLLGGLVRCPNCWRCMQKKANGFVREGRKQSGYIYSYACQEPACDFGSSVKMELLEDHVMEKLWERGKDVQAAVISADDEEQDQRALQVAEDELEAWLTLKSAVDKADWLKGYKTRQDAVKALHDKINLRYSSASPLNNIIGLREEWEDRPVHERRALLASTIDVVFVKRTLKEEQGRHITPERRKEIMDRRVLVLFRGQGPTELPKRGRRAGTYEPFLWGEDAPPLPGTPSEV